MTFTVFGVTGSWYGLTVGLGALLYLGTVGLLGFYKRLPAGTARVYGLLGLPLGLAFSRLAFCAVNYNYFSESVSQPLKMLFFWDGGYSLLGVLLGLFLAAFLTARLKKARFGDVLDAAAAPLGLLLCVWRAAEYFTNGQLGVGRQVDAGEVFQLAPWLFVQDQMGTLTFDRLAVYRYEAALALVILVFSLALFFGRKQIRHARPGDVAMIVAALYGATQVILESLRDDGHMVAGFIRVQQVGYAFLPLLALWILGARYAHIRGKRKAVTAAWLLLPVAALVILLMVYPINHVLDLTGHRDVGFIILAVLAVYLALFLRKKGADAGLIVRWLVTLAALAGCVLVEFSVDGSNNLLRDYGIMVGCCLFLFLMPYGLWRRLEDEVYREESIRVQIPRAW